MIVEFENIELDTCVTCRGLWFDAQELAQLFELAGTSDRLGELEWQVDRLPHVGPRRKCPRCRSPLEAVQAPTAEHRLILDECPRGDGLWFDQGELDALLHVLFGNDGRALENVRAYLGDFMSINGPVREAKN